jgi:GNAT superfamily N-acetyltransferase
MNESLMIRPSVHKELPELMALFSEARATIAALGIDQWQNGYPNEEIVTEDIEKQRSYAARRGEALCGTFVLMEREPLYDRIQDGEWLTGDRIWGYLAIHRVAVAVACRGQGISTAILNFAEEEAKTRGLTSLRIDTHKGNVVMRRMLEKHGFSLCGVIHLANGDPRVAYERRVGEEAR